MDPINPNHNRSKTSNIYNALVLRDEHDSTFFLQTILMLTKILRLWSMPKSHRGREVVTNLWCRHLTGSSQLWRHNTFATWCTRVHGIPAQRCISMTSSYSKFLMAFCLRYIFHCWISVCHQTQIGKCSENPVPHHFRGNLIWAFATVSWSTREPGDRSNLILSLSKEVRQRSRRSKGRRQKIKMSW